MTNWIPGTARAFAARLLDEEERFIPIIPCEDEPVHTDERPFCGDESCPCHSLDNFVALWRLKTQLNAGLVTHDEHIRIWRGENI